jgi:hypothetical protein
VAFGFGYNQRFIVSADRWLEKPETRLVDTWGKKLIDQRKQDLLVEFVIDLASKDAL